MAEPTKGTQWNTVGGLRLSSEATCFLDKQKSQRAPWTEHYDRKYPPAV